MIGVIFYLGFKERFFYQMKYRDITEMILRAQWSRTLFSFCVWHGWYLVLGLKAQKLRIFPTWTPPNGRKEQMSMETKTVSVIGNGLSQARCGQKEIYQYVGN